MTLLGRRFVQEDNGFRQKFLESQKGQKESIRRIPKDRRGRCGRAQVLLGGRVVVRV